jgi:zinc protease
LLLQAIFPGHSYSLQRHGREEVVATLTSEKLRDWHALSIARRLPLAIIVGDTDGSALVSSQIAEGFKRRDADTAIQVKTPQAATAAEKIEQSRREQTALALGFPGPKAESADLAALQLIQFAMNGEGGRLLGELRDKQHLVSSAAVGDKAMFVAGVIFAQLTTSPENEQRARTALLSELERVARSGLAADELACAHALEATTRAEMLQSQSNRVLRYAQAILYRQPASEVDSFAERTSKLTTEDIKRVASTYFKVSAASSGFVRGTPQTTAPPPPRQD